MKKILAIITIFFFALIVAGTATAADNITVSSDNQTRNLTGSNPSWSSPQIIPEISRDGRLFDIAADLNGNWQMVQVGTSESGHDIVKYKDSTGSEKIIANGAVFYSTIFTGNDGTTHVTYIGGEDIEDEDPNYHYKYDVMYTKKTNDIWSSPQQIYSYKSNTAGDCFRYDLAGDSNGNWQLVIVELSESGDGIVKYKDSNGSEKVIANGQVYNVKIFTGNDGTTHIAYTNYRNSQIMYTKKTNDIWSSPQPIYSLQTIHDTIYDIYGWYDLAADLNGNWQLVLTEPLGEYGLNIMTYMDSDDSETIANGSVTILSDYDGIITNPIYPRIFTGNDGTTHITYIKITDSTIQGISETKYDIMYTFDECEVYALLVGVSDYEYGGRPDNDPDTFDDLPNCFYDVGYMGDILVNDCGFKLENVEVLNGSAASTSGITGMLDYFANKVTANDLFVFYFAGHGIQYYDQNPLDEDYETSLFWGDGNFDEFICPYEYNPNDHTNMISDDGLMSKLNNINSNRTLCIFDSCFSGGMFGGDNDINGDKYTVLAACGEKEESYGIPDQAIPSLFTAYLIHGILNPVSDTETGDNDGWISAEEAFTYTRPKVISEANEMGKNQHPTIYNPDPAEIELHKISNKTTTLDPVNGASNVPSDKAITVNFNEPILEGDFNLVQLQTSSGTIIPTTKSISNRMLMITPTNTLEEDNYILIIYPGAITNITGNPTTNTITSSFSVGNATNPTYYIYPGGNIQTTINNATNGATILIHGNNGNPTTYTENITIDKKITLKSAGDGTVTIQAANSNQPVILITNSGSGSTIQDLTIINGWAGICLDNSTGNTLTNNTITNNQEGIFIANSSTGNTITSNNIHNNSGIGVNVLGSSTGNTVSSNTVSSNGVMGVFLQNAATNTISGNTVQSNGWTGICLDHAVNNIINNGNEVNDNGEGIFLANASTGNTIQANNIHNNTGTGISVLGGSNNNIIRANTAINHNGVMGVFIQNSDNNQILGDPTSGNDIQLNGWAGICLDHASHNIISKTSASAYYNVVGRGQEGIFLANNSNYNTISNCYINSNTGNGVNILNSNNNTIEYNPQIISNCVSGIFIQKSTNTIIHQNLMNYNTWGGVILDTTTNTTVYQNNISNSPQQTLAVNGTQNTFHQDTTGNYYNNWTTTNPRPIDGNENIYDQYPNTSPF